jgi:hypothetical protein
LMATRIHELFLSKAVSYLDSQEKRKYVEKWRDLESKRSWPTSQKYRCSSFKITQDAGIDKTPVWATTGTAHITRVGTGQWSHWDTPLSTKQIDKSKENTQTPDGSNFPYHNTAWFFSSQWNNH